MSFHNEKEKDLHDGSVGVYPVDDHLHHHRGRNSIIDRNIHLDDDELATTHHGDHGIKRELGPRVVSMIAIAGTCFMAVSKAGG